MPSAVDYPIEALIQNGIGTPPTPAPVGGPNPRKGGQAVPEGRDPDAQPIDTIADYLRSLGLTSDGAARLASDIISNSSLPNHPGMRVPPTKVTLGPRNR